MTRIKFSILILSILALEVMVAGCKTALTSDHITTVITRGMGLRIGATASATETPEINLGTFSAGFRTVPTSTNMIYAPDTFDAFESDVGWNPFQTGFKESFGTGYVATDTNATGRAIIPKVAPPKFTPPASLLPSSNNPNTSQPTQAERQAIMHPPKSQ